MNGILECKHSVDDKEREKIMNNHKYVRSIARLRFERDGARAIEKQSRANVFGCTQNVPNQTQKTPITVAIRAFSNV